MNEERNELNATSGSARWRLLETGDILHSGVQHLADDIETWIDLDPIWYGAKYHKNLMPAREQNK